MVLSVGPVVAEETIPVKVAQARLARDLLEEMVPGTTPTVGPEVAVVEPGGLASMLPDPGQVALGAPEE